MGIGESQAAPVSPTISITSESGAERDKGMHPYTYGTQSGVAWGNQPIDQMGNPTYPGMGRNMYGYGQPRYY
jgi:hypothetical protein